MTAIAKQVLDWLLARSRRRAWDIFGRAGFLFAAFGAVFFSTFYSSVLQIEGMIGQDGSSAP
jgi:hypothetical protein